MNVLTTRRLAGRIAAAALIFGIHLGTAQAATITVNDLADDVFPDSSGVLRDINDAPLPPLAAAKCTLRMAIASANLDIPVGGATFGCASGAAGVDTIQFAASLDLATTPGTIVLANKGMSPAPAVLPGDIVLPPLLPTTPMIIVGPGSSNLTLDGSLAAVDGRRILGVTDTNEAVAMQFTLSGVRLLQGRTLNNRGGCMISTESVSLTDVVFEYCEAVSGATDGGFGGAVMVGADSAGAGNARPDVTITGSRFIGNQAIRGRSTQRSEGGALALGGTPAPAATSYMVGAVTITNTVFNGNSADTRGGMIIGDATSVTISGSSFIGNASNGSNATGTSGRHGGFLISGVSQNVVINNGTQVRGNVANEERAGFSLFGVVGNVTIDQVDVTGNHANRGNVGGFEVFVGDCFTTPTGAVTISNSRIEGNSAAGAHGGFRVVCSGPLTMTDVQVIGNQVRGFRALTSDLVNTGNSAGGLDTLPSATLTRVTIARNSTLATAAGGGAFVFGVANLGGFTADGLRFVDNYLTHGGGLYLAALAAGRNYLIVNSEFSGNNAESNPTLNIEGDGNYTLRNSTISGNLTRPGNGSTMLVNANASAPGALTLAIEHSTISRNIADFEEALAVRLSPNQPNLAVATPTLFAATNPVITVKNSILGPRSPGYALASTLVIDPALTNVTATNSLLEFKGAVAPAFCAGAGMKCDVGSLLSPLAFNGGTSGVRTMALMAGSPAIDAGGAILGGLTTDARGTGFPRLSGAAVDMGAYESTSATTFGCTLDADGSGSADALTDGLLLMRSMFGLTGTAATTGALGANASRSTWTTIRNYLNVNCGTSFAP